MMMFGAYEICLEFLSGIFISLRIGLFLEDLVVEIRMKSFYPSFLDRILI